MLKYAASVGTVGLVNLGFINDASIAIFNLPILVPIMACTGAILSFAYDDDDDKKKTKLSKKKAVFLVLANTLVVTALVSVLPGYFGWSWYSPKMQGSLALILAASAKFIIPVFKTLLLELVRKWFRLGEYKKEEGGDDEVK